jgi:hypothetical protein
MRVPQIAWPLLFQGLRRALEFSAASRLELPHRATCAGSHAAILSGAETQVEGSAALPARRVRQLADVKIMFDRSMRAGS